jgi:hypothetical protein
VRWCVQEKSRRGFSSNVPCYCSCGRTSTFWWVALGLSEFAPRVASRTRPSWPAHHGLIVVPPIDTCFLIWFVTFHWFLHCYQLTSSLLCSLTTCNRRRGRTPTSASRLTSTRLWHRLDVVHRRCHRHPHNSGLSLLCFRDLHYWLMKKPVVFHVHIKEYHVERVMRQFGKYHESPCQSRTPPPSVHK